jgi:hypothetical protein
LQATKYYADKAIWCSFGPHKLANAFDVFLKRKAVITRPSVPQRGSISAGLFPAGSIPIISKGPDFPNLNSNITTSAVDPSTKMMESSVITIDTITSSPQLSPSSQPFTTLLVEDNEINLKVRTQPPCDNEITYITQLLIMYMRKLKKPYQTAMNGQEAVQTFKENPLALRLILMG